MNKKPQCAEFAPLMLPNESGQGMKRLACIKESHSDDEQHETAEHSFMGFTVKLTWKSPKVGRGTAGNASSSTPA